MAVLLLILTIVIGGYTYLTDSQRVRDMAQGYLSRLLGGRVMIGSARLSIFEGLELDNVEVHVDKDPSRPDSLLFSAQSLVLNQDLLSLAMGKLEATQIIAQKPHVYLTLTQTSKADTWNYHRLVREEPATRPSTKGPMHRLQLPEVLLRNAIIEISQVKAGQRLPPHGKMYIDGQLTPGADGEHYELVMQTRGVSKELGPWARGKITLKTGQVDAELHNLQFSEDLRNMFPANMRDWWGRHDVSGAIDIPRMNYTPGHNGGTPKFEIETTLQHVTLAVHREEWSSHDEVARWERLQNAIGFMREPYRVAGYRVQSPEDEGQNSRPPASGDFASPFEVMAQMMDTPPLRLRDVSGTFVFTQDGINVPELNVKVGAGTTNARQTNDFVIRGHISDYGPDAAMHLQIASSSDKPLFLPAQPKFLGSLPREVREIYNDLRPEGNCKVTVQVDRPNAGDLPRINGEIEIQNATFTFRQFPYAFRQASGKIAFGREAKSGKDYVIVKNMHGRGLLGGPNENSEVSISGIVGPLGPDTADPGFKLRGTGTNICSEPALLAAMPADVRQALKVFDAPGKGEFPKFRGNFVCNVWRPPGRNKRFTFDTDVDLLDSSGRVVGFPYPFDHVHAKLKVRDGYVDIENATMTGRAGGVGVVNGRVRWADDQGHNRPLDLKLTASVRGMPIDNDLIAALPPEHGEWLRRLGIGGKLEVDGRIFTEPQKFVPSPGHTDPPVRYDLALGVRDGTLWPADGMFCVSAVAGKLHVTQDRLDILDLRGRRDGAQVAAKGSLTFSGSRPRLDLHVSAKDLALDHPLYAMLPVEGRRAWDEVQPQGRVNADIDYRGALGGDAPAAPAIASLQMPLDPREADGFHVLLRPKDLSVRLRSMPYAMRFDRGTVSIEPGKAELEELVGHHGKATITVSGAGSTSQSSHWDLRIKALDLAIDQELRKAMPAAMLSIVDSLKLRGNLGLDLSKLEYSSTSSSADPDIKIVGAITLDHGSMDVGMPLENVHGGIPVFKAWTHEGKLESLSGSLLFDSLTLNSRPLRQLKLDLLKQPGRNELHVDHIQARVAGGELAGGVLITFPDEGANRYNMNLVVRNADVSDLTGDRSHDIRGELTASLALEGAWGESVQRRGRGDVVVAGQQLYQIPLMLGLLQITNLSLPIGGPFTKGIARYTVDGERINFEQMELRADTMMMSGTGYLDFGSKKVSLTLATDNPSGFRIPFIHDLWQGARQQLLRINVRGTVKDPRVEPTSMGIVTTTIDEVFKGDSPRK